MDSHAVDAKPAIKLPKTDMPTFEGEPKLWRRFWERFTQRLDMHPTLPASEKIAQLEQAIKPLDGKALISAPKGTESEYQECIKNLKARYDQPRKIYRAHVHEVMDHSTPYTTEGYYELDTLLQDAMAGMSLYGGKDAGSVLVAIAEKGLRSSSLSNWVAHCARKSVTPTLDVFRQYLKQKAEELGEDQAPPRNPPQKTSNPYKPSGQSYKRPAHTQVFHTNQKSKCCKLCGDLYHSIFMCSDFKSQAVDQRQATVQRLKLCLNCLGADHFSKKCPSKRTCRTCGKRHNSLLHRTETHSASTFTVQPEATAHQSAQPPPQPYYYPVPYPPHLQYPYQGQSPSSIPSSATSPSATSLLSTMESVCLNASGTTAIILGTCVTTIESKGRQHRARALIDYGSSLTFITEKLVSTLKARKIAESTTVMGFQQTSTPVSQSKVDLYLKVPSGTVTVLIPVRAVVVDVISGDLPASSLSSVKQDPCLLNLPLADPHFDRPGKIDLLLGVDILPRIMMEGRRTSLDYTLSASKSVYGWIVMGTCQSSMQVPRSHLCLKTTSIDQHTQDLLTRLWQVEDVTSDTTIRTEEEKAALQHFTETHDRSPEGRYVVKLPRKETVLAIGSSRDQAVRRFQQNRRTLERKGKWEEFSSAVNDYAIRKHSERVPGAELGKPATEVYYLPMHGVVKDSSTTTKLRVVFDASARSSSGVSLNDQLLPGPNLYPHLSNTVMHFRQHRFGMTGDISMMFREIGLDKTERDYHRYLVSSQESKLEDWRKTRLTFGVTSSPFLATQVLHQVASDHEKEFPNAAAIIRAHFYVDDVLTGADTLTEAVSIRAELNGLLNKACMTLRKWRTNSPELLDTIPEELWEKDSLQLLAAPGDCQKALGIHWDTGRDQFHVATPSLSPHAGPTKRQVASDMARTFDLLGWFSPAVVIVKILLQKLWKLGMTWNEPVPESLAAVWRSWMDELHYITDHPIARCYYSPDKTRLHNQLHCFSDASNVAYGGVVYVRMLYKDTTVSVSMVLAKTKVAPISPAGTTPRLELCGAQIPSKLLQTAMTNPSPGRICLE